MHIFVINLPEDIQRKVVIEKQLQELKLDYELFSAIRGTLISQEDKLIAYDDIWFYRNEGRSATLGELGCALSHIEIYRRIIEQNISHALILEDDAWLNPNLPQLLTAIEQKYSPEQKNVFLLTWFSAISQRKLQTLWAHYHIAKVKSAYCAHGYVISNAAAGALLNVLYPVAHVADCWNWLQRHRIAKIWAVFPTCITVDMSYETGTTAELNKTIANKPLFKKLTHKAYRGFWYCYDYLLAVKSRLGNSL